MKIPCWLGLFSVIASAALAADVSLTVSEPGGVPRTGWPVTSGVPFAAGTVRDANAVTLRDATGRSVALQTEVLGRWPDGSVRWLLLDFQTDLAASETKTYSLRTETYSAPAVGALVTQSGDGTIVDTGPLRLELSRAALDPFGAVWVDRNGDGKFTDDERITRGGEGLFVRDAEGKRFTSVAGPADIVVEESGPLRACVRVTGRFAAADGSLFSYVLRLHAFRGQRFVKCAYTFTNDYQGAVMASIKELGLSTRLAAESSKTIALLNGQMRPGGRVYQLDEAHYLLDGQPAGTRAPGWAATSGPNGGFAVGVREWWQQWPKSLEARDGTLTVGLCPEFPAGLYDGKTLIEENKLYYALRRGLHTFKVGVAKTHEVWLDFFAGPASAGTLDAFFRATENPLLATCAPDYVSATRIAGDLPPADPKKFVGYDAWFERALADHLKRRDREREYGILNYGDWYGERQVNWGNLEYDLQHGLFLQYLRTGERKFFERGAQASRHHIDVDVVHATNPQLKNPWGLPPVPGQIWLHSLNHTGGYFANAPLPVDRTYQMGDSQNYGHVWVSGDLDYYFLTGDRRAYDVTLSVADMMASQMTQKVGTHIRTLGWPMILVLSAYEATNDPKYLAAAKRNWEALRQSLDWQRGWVVKLASDHCLHPAGSTTEQRNTIYKNQKCEGNVPFMEGLTLCALSRYHRITGDPEVLKAITVGLNQMIRECWLEDKKTFRYTACPLTTPAYDAMMLSSEALAYEGRLTNNAEHLRVLREGVAMTIARNGSGFGKSFGQMTFFTPFALSALESTE